VGKITDENRLARLGLPTLHQRKRWPDRSTKII